MARDPELEKSACFPGAYSCASQIFSPRIAKLLPVLQVLHVLQLCLGHPVFPLFHSPGCSCPSVKSEEVRLPLGACPGSLSLGFEPLGLPERHILPLRARHPKLVLLFACMRARLRTMVIPVPTVACFLQAEGALNECVNK